MDVREKERFYELYKRNIDAVYQISFLHLKNKNDAEDAVQTVFMKYLTLMPEFQNRNHEKSWFILTARNHCRDILKHWWNSRRSSDEYEKSYIAFEDKPDGDITAALLKIPEKYRELIYLYYYEEYSVKEISGMINKNESTIRTQLARAREKLRKIIDLEGKEDERDKIFQSI